MTETEYEVDLLKAIYNVLPNEPLTDLLFRSFERVGAPQFGDEEYEFATQISETLSQEQKRSALEGRQVPDKFSDKVLCDEVLPEPPEEDEPRGSTDVGDVSWCAPTARLRVACLALGTPGHSWQYTAQAGMGIGHAGMLTAAKVLAEAGYELITNPELLKQVRKEFERKTEGKPFESALPPDHEPAHDQFSR